MVSKHRQTLKLPLPGDLAVTLVTKAATDLGWNLNVLADGSLEIHEDATRLHCHCSPLRALVTLTGIGESATVAEIEGRVPGRGPIAGKHVREQTDLLTRGIGRRALEAGRSGLEAQRPPVQ